MLLIYFCLLKMTNCLEIINIRLTTILNAIKSLFITRHDQGTMTNNEDIIGTSIIPDNLLNEASSDTSSDSIINIDDELILSIKLKSGNNEEPIVNILQSPK